MSFRVGLLSALAFVVIMGADASAVLAADLEDRYPTPRPSPYDDPRYRDMYEVPPPRPPEPVYRDERVERDHGERLQPRRYAREETGCLDNGEVRRKLRAEGWHDFDDVERDGRFVHMEAERQANGREFDLTVDACTGEIVEAIPQDVRRRVSRLPEDRRPLRYDRRGAYDEDRTLPPPRYGRYDPRY